MLRIPSPVFGDLSRLAMNMHVIQGISRLPGFLGASLLVVFLFSVSFSAQAQEGETPSAVTVQDLEDLAEVMEDEAAREQLLSRIRTLIETRKNTQVEPQVESASR